MSYILLMRCSQNIKNISVSLCAYISSMLFLMFPFRSFCGFAFFLLVFTCHCSLVAKTKHSQNALPKLRSISILAVHSLNYCRTGKRFLQLQMRIRAWLMKLLIIKLNIIRKVSGKFCSIS